MLKQEGSASGWRTLRQQLFLLLTVLALGPLLLSNAWGYFATRAQLMQIASRNLRNVAELEAAQTLNFTRTKLDLVRSIVVDNEYLFGLLRAMMTARDEVVRRSLEHGIRTHLGAKAGNALPVDYFVLSPEGKLLGASRDRATRGDDLSDTACFRNGVGARAADLLTESGQPRLLIAMPVRDPDGLIGIFCAHFDLSLQDEFASARLLRTTRAELYLLDAESRPIIGSFHGTRTLASAERQEVAARALLHGRDRWETRYALPSSEEVIAAYVPVTDLGWGVLVEEPVDEALASLHQIELQALPLCLALAVLLAVAIHRIAKRLTTPLKSLLSAARRTANGALGESVVPDGPMEVRELTRAFNDMSAALKDAHLQQERRIAERTHELQESREFADLLLNSIEQHVVVIDRSLTITKANQAACRRYREDIVGSRCDDVFASQPSSAELAKRVFASGTPASLECSESIGESRDIVERDAFPVFSDQGEVDVVVQIGRVVTNERRLLAQSMHQERMAAFGLLAAGIAHEIGNPLAAIESQLQLTQQAPEPGRVEQTLAILGREVARISRLMRGLVNFARRRRDDIVLVSLNQVIEDVARLLEHDPRARKVHIEQHFEQSLPGVRAKEDQLVQILLNLGINALDAMPEGGTLEFATAASGAQVVVRVRDTGGGVPAEVQGRLCEPFLSTKGGRGTGLGLFVSRGIAEELGGQLALESTGTAGSVFSLALRAELEGGGE